MHLKLKLFAYSKLEVASYSSCEIGLQNDCVDRHVYTSRRINLRLRIQLIVYLNTELRKQRHTIDGEINS